LVLLFLLSDRHMPILKRSEIIRPLLKTNLGLGEPAHE
jgi:hypothetical protein